jgi:hypothetical protein
VVAGHAEASPPSASITARSTAIPPWIVTGAARTQPSQNVAEGMRKAIALGEIGKQPRACVTDHPAPVRRDDEPGT